MRLAAPIAIVLALMPAAARSQYEQDFGAVSINYNALRSDRLLPEMAQRYGIVRSRDRAIVNLAVQGKQPDGSAKTLHATISGFAVSLGGKRTNIPFREITENGTISYIGQIPISSPDTYRFTISAMPESTTTPYTVIFNQDFVD
ncbi:MAG TPA: DUF4426 domain-containing protein [Rhodanobacteraceae bacterium]|jgi:hypothetical protein|nr:DUF4426 domain-containing protein [Rhodanobacteraceae bacterium]